MNILCVVDNHNWCWSSTAKEIASHLPNHQFTFVPAKNFISSAMCADDFDLLWCRGYPSVVQDLAPRETPWIATIATGGTRLERRMIESDRHLQSRTLVGIVTQCNAAKVALEAKGYRTWLIPNGVNQEIFFPDIMGLAEGEPIIGLAANVEDPERAELKGVPYLQEACNELKVKCDIVSDMTQANLAKWYRKLAIYCQPSRAEGCSNSVMEAMASGIPTLIADGVGYHGEVCENMREVIFIKRNPVSIAKSIKKVLNSRRLASELRQNAIAFAKIHSWDKIAKRYNEVFEFTQTVEMPKVPRVHMNIVVSAKEEVWVSDIQRKKGELFMVTLAEYRQFENKLELIV